MHNNVLYRKYRPVNYSQVVGQQINLQILQNIVVNEEEVHALLFCGTRGTGKTTLAKIFAKSLLCENFKENKDLCGKCSQCQKKDNQNYSIIEIDAASNNGVEEVRNIRENIEIGTDSGKKVYIIDEVHMFSKSAFNALLKTIEEPPANVYFILATTEEDKIPNTILSRCLKLDFKLNNNQELKEYFKKITQLEKINLNDEGIDLIVQSANESIRDGLSVLEKIKMYAGNTNEIISEQVISQIIGTIPNRVIEKLIMSIQKNDFEQIEIIVEEISKYPFNWNRFLEQLIILATQNNLDQEIENNLFKLYLEIKNIHSSQLFFLKLKNSMITYNKSKNKKEKQTQDKIQVIEINNSDVDQLMEIDRITKINIGEILETATKDDKNTAQNKLSNLKKYLNNIDYVHVINCINDKCEVVAASANGIILSTNSEAVVQFLNDNQTLLDKLLSNVYSHQLGYHILDEIEWQKIRNEYIQKIQIKKQIEKARKDLLEVFNEKK